MVKAKLRSGKDKGGCLIGKKEKSTPGGCKVGRKGVNAKAKAPAKPKAKAPAKPKAKAPAKPKSPGQIEAARIKAKNKRPKKKEGARVVNKKPRVGGARIPPKEAKGVMKSKAEKKARIQQKVKDLGKAQIAKKKQPRQDYEAPAKTHIVLGQEVPLNIRLAGVSDYRGGIKDDGKQFSEGGSLTTAQKRATQGTRGSFVIIDDKSGKVYDSLKDLDKGKDSGEAVSNIKYKRRRRPGIRIQGVGDFVKAPLGGDPSYAFNWIGDMYNSR